VQAPPERVLSDPHVVAAYLGNSAASIERSTHATTTTQTRSRARGRAR
jgi:hypothetical protein